MDVYPLLESYAIVFDEIVIIDSTRPNKDLWPINDPNDERIHVYSAPAFDFVEPLKAFGVSKCNTDFVLNIDADEKPSADLLKDIGKIISDTEFTCYSIYRINQFEDGKGIFSEYLPSRLFRRDYIKLTGYVHEHPRILGSQRRLDKKYYLINTKLRRTLQKAMFNGLNASMYLDRLCLSDCKDFAVSINGVLGEFTNILIRIYKYLIKRSDESELLYREYQIVAKLFLFFSLLKNPTKPRLSFHFYKYLSKKYKQFYLTSKQVRSEQWLVSKTVRHFGGPIKFLRLDNDVTIDDLYQRYISSDVNGETFFIELLKERVQLIFESGIDAI